MVKNYNCRTLFFNSTLEYIAVKFNKTFIDTFDGDVIAFVQLIVGSIPHSKSDEIPEIIGVLSTCVEMENGDRLLVSQSLNYFIVTTIY